MSDVDKLFSGMANAPMFGRGNYMGAGTFRVQLKSVQVKARFKGGNVFIAEFSILESDNPAHKVGSTGSWCPKIELPNTFGDIKSLVFAALGVDPKTVKAEDVAAHEQAALLARAACGSSQAIEAVKAAGLPESPLVGQIVRLECVQTKTKANTDFTRYTWSPDEN